MSKLGDLLRKIRRPRPAGPRPEFHFALDGKARQWDTPGIGHMASILLHGTRSE